MGNNNTYTTGKTVTVNNIISSNSKSMKKNQKYNDKYNTIIMCLDSMEEKDKRHAIVDVEYILETQYNFKKTIEKDIYQFIKAIGKNIKINNIRQYVFGNMTLCNFVVIFLYGISCFSCFFEIFKAAF